MQLFILMLVIGLVAHDAALATPQTGPALTWETLVYVLGPKLFLLVVYALACRRAVSALGSGRSAPALKQVDRAGNLLRVGVMASYLVDLFWLELLGSIRQTLGDQILLDELLVLAPPLLALTLSWWFHYPIDQRLRQGQATVRLMQGLPAFPIWTRSQYLLAQFRLHVALILAPVLVIVAWTEVVHFYVPDRVLGPVTLGGMLTLAGAWSVLLFSPVMVRYLWDTVPLEEGPLRQRLVEMCHRHRVRVRQLLEWRTFGGMINAAVMGLIAPVRYVLLTDALLDAMPAPHVEAVMAHELGHVKRKHMIGLLISAVATLGLSEIMWSVGMEALYSALLEVSWFPQHGHPLRWFTLAGTALALVTWALLFGWISRRFERQADTFAVQHLAMSRARAQGMIDHNTLIDPHAVQTMVDALGHVAALNCIDPHKRSWRHGSIAWRQRYLTTLVGQRVDQLDIDEIAWRINFLSMLGLAVVILLETGGICGLLSYCGF